MFLRFSPGWIRASFCPQFCCRHSIKKHFHQNYSILQWREYWTLSLLSASALWDQILGPKAFAAPRWIKQLILSVKPGSAANQTAGTHGPLAFIDRLQWRLLCLLHRLPKVLRSACSRGAEAPEHLLLSLSLCKQLLPSRIQFLSAVINQMSSMDKWNHTTLSFLAARKEISSLTVTASRVRQWKITCEHQQPGWPVHLIWLRVSACHFCPLLGAWHSSEIKSEQATDLFLEMKGEGVSHPAGVSDKIAIVNRLWK